MVTFKRNDVIEREGKKWQCIVCDDIHACFARYERISHDQEHTDHSEIFLTINNAPQHFEFKMLSTELLGNIGSEGLN